VVQSGYEQMQCINSNTRYLHDKIVKLAEKLTSKMPTGSNLNVCFFVNSGSEANDLAVRLARVYTGRNTILALQNSYHGTTGTCTGISASISTGKSDKCPDFDYYARDVEYVRTPDLIRGPYSKETAVEEYLKDVDQAIIKRRKATTSCSSSSCSESDQNEETKKRKINDETDVAAFIHESIQGVGGQIVFPEGYLAQVYKRVHDNGGICIADEVQTGFGRVGTHFWAFETDNVVPDIVTMLLKLSIIHNISILLVVIQSVVPLVWLSWRSLNVKNCKRIH